MPPKKGGKKGATGYKMAPKLPNGTVLQDMSKKKWTLTGTVGSGGFGLIYFAEEEGGERRKCVVKIEPHENGPLFVEWHYYLAAGRPEHLKAWKEPAHLPALWGYGSHSLAEEKLRFIVIDKLGADLDKTFKGGETRLSIATIANIAIQVLHSLEYIHSKGYTHNDVKAANLLSHPDNPNLLYLVDFGLAVKYMKGEENAHKEEKPDPRKAHDGTIEYLSRDAHLGCTARRSDLENLALCLVHWSVGTLPWQSLISKVMKPADTVKVQAAKEEFFKGLPATGKHLPKQVLEFLEYAAGLHFDQCPDYKHCRSIFSKVASKGLVLDGLGEDSSKKPKKAAKVGAGKRKVREGEEIVNDGSNKRPAEVNGADLGSPALRNGGEMVEEESPAPAKKGRKVVKAKVPAKGKKSANAQAAELLGRKMRNGGGAGNMDSGSEEDMFAASPSPAKKFDAPPSPVKKFAASASPVKKVVNREFKEMGSQVSPAFVAAGKEARRKDKLAAAGGKKKEELATIPTPAMVEVKSRSKPNNGVEKSEEDVMENPTPAMMAIMQKRQEAEKAGGSKKKAASKVKKLKN